MALPKSGPFSQISAEDSSSHGPYGFRPVLSVFGIGFLVLAVLKVSEGFVSGTFDLPIDSFALTGLVAAQLILESGKRSTLLTCILGPVFGIIYTLSRPDLSIFAAPLSVGVVSLAVLVTRLVLVPRERKQGLLTLAAGSLACLAVQFAEYGRGLSTASIKTFDQRAYLVDLSAGIDIVSIVQSSIRAMPGPISILLVLIITLSYHSISLMMAVTVLTSLKERSGYWLQALLAFVLAGAIGGVLYHLFPASGPIYAFETFPDMPRASLLTTDRVPINPIYARNCMPSLHLTWALLIVYNSLNLPKGSRVSAYSFLIITGLSTLWLGEHYFIDLVVAVPFSVAVQALAGSTLARKWPCPAFYACSGIVAFWFYALVVKVQWFLDTTAFTACAMVLTLALSTALAVHLSLARSK